ncbi:Hypothetical predicted protein [Paramuricea clavata]|uniref:Uncharacterized protein n=1 Tax=Paramuricea clavata TaxID=317549 RepID=A0A7D9IR45_PARCT|nr:Hypothetical predicted protein [Paramuricea clavata]
MADNKFLRARLKHERNWLENYYNGEKFAWNWRYGMALFERNIKTSWNNVYRLRILVGENYPEQLPDLVVCASPKPMPKSSEWQGTHTTHTWSQKHGLLQICFYHPLCWTRENMLYEVFEKGEQWLEAYEEHLATGKPMNELLSAMEPTEEELQEEERHQAKYERRMAKINQKDRRLGLK